jgi:RimJ/RimL family protein N-acetyltransferase
MYTYESNTQDFSKMDILDSKGKAIAVAADEESAITIVTLLNQDQVPISRIATMVRDTKERYHRVTLKPIQPSDIDIITEIYSDKKLSKYDDWSVDTIIIDETLSDMIDPVDWEKEYTHFNYIIYSGDEKIGFVAVTIQPYQQAELGYYVASKYQKHGYASSALKEIIKIAKKNKIHRVYSFIDPKNKASIKTAQYSGMIQCGHTHHSSKVRGKWVDDVIMEKILK